ncbi:MAG: glutaminase A [Pseudomonadota bacterium]
MSAPAPFPVRRTEPSPPGSPVADYLARLHARLAPLTGGAAADYIPELGKVDPGRFAIAVATVDGQVYGVGDDQEAFTIQSVSKPFAYGYALREHPKDVVMAQVGVEPTGEAFNSIILDQVNNRPFNPMVNAGAIAVAELIKGETQDARERAMRAFFSDFAARDLEVDEDVFRSESATGHRNRAIAYMMLASGMIGRDPAEVLELYFRQCSLKVTCRDLAVMAATLANRGVNPVSGTAVLGPDHVRDVLTVMNTCGMYDYAGQWAFEVGIPAKSGVSGAIIAVIPGQIGLAVWSPPVDAQGASVRGVAACKAISEDFGLHLLNSAASPRGVIRREYRACDVGSKRLRAPEARAALAEKGARIAVVELQGALYFGSVERLIRRVRELSAEASHVLVDFRRVHDADPAAARLARHMAEGLSDLPAEVSLVSLAADGPLGELRGGLAAIEASGGLHLHADLDAGLEWAETALLAEQAPGLDGAKFALRRLDLFRGLDAEELRLLEHAVQPMRFEAGAQVLRKGDPANAFFVIARGSVSVRIPLDGGGEARVAGIGPGLSFGEMALIDGGARSADVYADETLICYALGVDRLRELARTHPNVMITLLANLTREFAGRLGRANAEIAALA